MLGASPKVKDSPAQDPAYRPTHPQTRKECRSRCSNHIIPHRSQMTLSGLWPASAILIDLRATGQKW